MHRDHITSGEIAEGKRDDPWACLYGEPSNHYTESGEWKGTARCICGYCRDGRDCCPENSDYSQRARRDCGHAANAPLCACIKVYRTPISPEDAFALLARSQ